MRILLLLFLPTFLFAQTTVSNETPRLTPEGKIVDAHDGRVIQFGDQYYWYGTSYGNTSGFTIANHYVCYRSSDLLTWTYEGKLLPNQAAGVYYRPHVIYHRASGKYVLWYNWYPKLWAGQFGVATSDTPTGPFEVVDPDVQMKHSEIGLGDFGLFVDEDQTAYLAYNTIQDHQVSIERLSTDYLSSTLENGGFLAKHCEAGSMFKREGRYYLLTDYTCCFCGEGSGARVYISDNPLNGYEQHGNINRYPGIPQPQLSDGKMDRFGNLQLDPNHGLLVQSEQPFDALELTFAWRNYRSHCQPDNKELRHPDDLLPNLHFFYRTDSLEVHEPIAENSYQRMTLTYQLPTDQYREIRFKLFPSAVDQYELIEVRAMRNEVPVKERTEVFELGKGQPPIIPAQQTHIMELETTHGTQYIWMGDLWGSRPDNIKGHDQQYWSAPLQFKPDGSIERLAWTGQWSVKLAKD